MKLTLCRNLHAPLFGSMTLHAFMLALLCFFAGRQIVTQQPSGITPITVRLISMAQVESKQPEPEKKIERTAMPLSAKHLTSPKPEVKTEKPAEEMVVAPAKTSAPEQHWQEAKSDNNGPKILYQPMPKIPDDLRREAFSTSAMARFHVAADGSTTVELLTPSQNPRLNHILLETLKTWKFAPATQGGNATESNFDIRVHFAVE